MFTITESNIYNIIKICNWWRDGRQQRLLWLTPDVVYNAGGRCLAEPVLRHKLADFHWGSCDQNFLVDVNAFGVQLDAFLMRPLSRLSLWVRGFILGSGISGNPLTALPKFPIHTNLISRQLSVRDTLIQKAQIMWSEKESDIFGCP